jgi:SAM-dependent methyltransferase
VNSNQPIAEFYRQHPYPLVRQVRAEPILLDHHFYQAHACYEDRSNRKMLVAGCGTTEAVNWALSLPDWQVDAVDLSDNSIAIARHLADQLDVKNLTIRLGNIEAGEGFDGPYTFINSQGVLHHFNDPAKGLAQLEKHLSPGGVMSLMLYSDSNRWFLQRGQRLFQLLLDQVEEDREQAAYEVCRTGSTSPNRLQTVFQSGVKNFEQDRPQFADTLLNPQEVSYTIPSLIDWLASAGMEMICPVYPDVWNPRAALGEKGAKLYDQLSPTQQWEVCDLVIGPLFFFVARRVADRGPQRPCATEDDLFWQIVPRVFSATVYDVKELAVIQPPTTRSPIIEQAGNNIRISRNKEAWSGFHPVAASLLQLIDGKRTLRQIAEQAATQHGATFEQVEDMLRGYLHHIIEQQGLAAADVSHCTNCPLRK